MSENSKPEFQTEEVTELDDNSLDDVSGGTQCSGCEGCVSCNGCEGGGLANRL